jgi:hypothetical protein
MRPPRPGILFPNFIGSKLIQSLLFSKVKKKFKLFNFKYKKLDIYLRRMPACSNSSLAGQSASNLSAVDDVALTRYEAGIVRRQKSEKPGDLFRPAEPAQRDFAFAFPEHFGRVFSFLHRCQNIPGTDSVDPDFGRQFQGRGAG